MHSIIDAPLAKTATPFLNAADVLLRETGCTVRKYRTRNTGVAYIYADDWGIEAPEPRGPVSFGTFAHEVGHQILHRPERRPRKTQRWLEELEAWEYALAQFDRFHLPGKERCEQDAAKALRRSVERTLKKCSPQTMRTIVERLPAFVEMPAYERGAA